MAFTLGFFAWVVVATVSASWAPRCLMLAWSDEAATLAQCRDAEIALGLRG